MCFFLWREQRFVLSSINYILYILFSVLFMILYSAPAFEMWLFALAVLSLLGFQSVSLCVFFPDVLQHFKICMICFILPYCLLVPGKFSGWDVFVVCETTGNTHETSETCRRFMLTKDKRLQTSHSIKQHKNKNKTTNNIEQH